MKLISALTTLLLTLTLVHATPTTFSPSVSHTNLTLRSLQKRCPPFDPSGTKNIGNGAAIQFVGGQCLSDADCQQGCCAKPCGICSGPAANFQNGKEGCGFGGGGSAGTASAGANANTNANANANANTAAAADSGDANGNANTDGNTGNGDDSSASSESNNNGNDNGNGNSCSGNGSNA